MMDGRLEKTPFREGTFLLRSGPQTCSPHVKYPSGNIHMCDLPSLLFSMGCSTTKYHDI